MMKLTEQKLNALQTLASQHEPDSNQRYLIGLVADHIHDPDMPPELLEWLAQL